MDLAKEKFVVLTPFKFKSKILNKHLKLWESLPT